MTQPDALTRLEAWLRGCPEEPRAATFGVYGAQFDVVIDYDGKQLFDRQPTLSAAIHAALDRAEEAGL